MIHKLLTSDVLKARESVPRQSGRSDTTDWIAQSCQDLVTDVRIWSPVSVCRRETTDKLFCNRAGAGILQPVRILELRLQLNEYPRAQPQLVRSRILRRTIECHGTVVMRRY